MRAIDLNADLGEEVTDDAALLAVVTSANVACGYHAGTPAIMRAVCSEAAERGVSVGAQVSYDDRANFGRVARDVARDVLREQVADQVGLLSGIAVAAGTAVRYLKPHGALYHRVLDDEEQARAVLTGPASCRCSGWRACCCRWPTRRADGGSSRASPTGAMPPTAGCCPLRAGCAGGGGGRDRRAGARPRGARRLGLPARRLAGAVAHAIAVRRALEGARYQLHSL